MRPLEAAASSAGDGMRPKWTCLTIAGVSGSGKTTVSRALAERLDWSVIEADSLHAESSIRKMHAGVALSDADRWPWLERVADSILTVRGRARGVVVACSALRRSYRDHLTEQVPDLVFCQLDVAPEVAVRRMTQRTGHFMDPSLQASQQSTLEPLDDDERGFRVDANQTLDRVLTDVIRGLTSLENRPGPNSVAHLDKAADRP